MNIQCPKCKKKYSVHVGAGRAVRCAECSTRFKTPDSSGPPPVPVENWYFIEAGNRVGPISDAELKQRIDSGVFHHETRVWKKGMDKWVELSAVMPGAFSAPPPVPSGSHYDGYMWLLCAVPLVGELLSLVEYGVYCSLSNYPSSSPFTIISTILCIAANIYLISRDVTILRKAGVVFDKAFLVLGSLIVPVYMFWRAAKFGGYAPAIVWVVSFVVSILIGIN